MAGAIHEIRPQLQPKTQAHSSLRAQYSSALKEGQIHHFQTQHQTTSQGGIANVPSLLAAKVKGIFAATVLTTVAPRVALSSAPIVSVVPPSLGRR